MKTLVTSTLAVMAMVISLSSVNGQHPPPPYYPAACFTNFTGVCSNTSTGAGIARCCMFWSNLMKNEDQHPCICSLFVVSNFSYEDSLGILLDCQVNVTGFNFCPDLRGSPKLSPPPPRGKILPSPPPTYNTTRKPPPQPLVVSDPHGTPTPPSHTSLVVGISVGAILFVLLLFVILFFLWWKLRRQTQPLTEDQRMKTFNYTELVRATNGFIQENLFGEGDFAYVYRGFLRGREVVVKKLKTVVEEEERQLRIDINAFDGLHQYKHVVSMIGHCITVNRRFLVYEFVTNGSLHSRLHGKGQQVMDWSVRMRIALGSAKGIAYLHHDCHPSIIHRDIKSANILLDEKFDAKIADFGLVMWKAEGRSTGYLAPEYAATGQVADIYSFGIVLIELITGRKPSAGYGPLQNRTFVDSVRPDLLKSIQDQNYDAIADPRLKSYNHDEMARMVACAVFCTQHEAEHRVTMRMIVQVFEGELDVNVFNPSSQSNVIFPYEELVQATDGFSDNNLIGDGAFAFVYKGLLQDDRVVAVKQLRHVGEQGLHELQIEIGILGGLHQHKRVVSLIGHCITQERRLLVYELVPKGNLYSGLHGKGEPIIDWPTRMKIAIGSARGLAYLHHDCHPSIIHRDIKSPNILLDENFDAKIADFGLAKFKPENWTHVSTDIKGTRGYLAPEYAATRQITHKSDIYSFGAVLIELITGRKPSASCGPSKNITFVDWERPSLIRSLEDQNYDAIADPRLFGDYVRNEMERIVACAISCILQDARLRPTMSLVVHVLEGEVDVNALNLRMTRSTRTR